MVGLLCTSDASSVLRLDRLCPLAATLSGAPLGKAVFPGQYNAAASGTEYFGSTVAVLVMVGMSFSRGCSCHARLMLSQRHRCALGEEKSAVALRPIRFGSEGIPQGASLESIGLKLSISTLTSQARSGSQLAQFELGQEYLSGNRVEADPARAANWFLKAAEQGVAEAQYNYGQMCLSGDGVKQDKLKGLSWMQKAADQDIAYAQLVMGSMLVEGDVVAQDVKTGISYLTAASGQGLSAEVASCISEAANKGDKDAQNMMGTMLFFGSGVEKNKEWAAYWFEQAAKNGAADAQYNLGLMLKSGDGVAENKEWARYWLEQAALNGNQSASKAIASL